MGENTWELRGDRRGGTISYDPPPDERLREFHERYLAKARAIGADGLTGQDRLSFDVFTLNRESALEDLKFPERLMPVNQFYNLANTFAQLGSGKGAQPFATVKDYDDWLARMPDDRAALEGIARCRAKFGDRNGEVTARAAIAEADATPDATWLHARALDQGRSHGNLETRPDFLSFGTARDAGSTGAARLYGDPQCRR